MVPQHRIPETIKRQGARTQITNAIREKIKEWPPNLPPPSVVIVHETHLPSEFDPNFEKLEGFDVITTLQIRKNSVRLAYLHEPI